MSGAFDEKYYEAAGLDRDRPALAWYERLVARLVPAGGKVLDFGCGNGHLLRRLSRRFHCLGFDPSPAARRQARAQAPGARIVESCRDLPRDTFDGVVALHTLEHIPAPLEALHTIHDLLRPGGRFLFVVPHTRGLGKRLKKKDWFAYRDPSHCSLLSREKWLELVRSAGFRVLDVHGDGMWDAPYLPWLPTIFQRIIFGAPAALQLLSPIARPFLPPYLGECLVVTAERPIRRQ